MFINEELQNHLETSPTIRSQSAVIAEWNMNIPTNILHIGNYRYRKSEPSSPYFALPNSFDPNETENSAVKFYYGATDSDITVDGTFNDDGLPVTLKSKNSKNEMLYSLEECFRPFRPRSGINKARYTDTKNISWLHNSNINMARRPRYYMSDKNDLFKYWSSYRYEDGERGISKPFNGQYAIDDVAPFVVYKNSMPANRVVVKMQTNIGDINLGLSSDPYYGVKNGTTPVRWKIQYLKNNSWSDIISFNESSRRKDNSEIVKSDGYVELAYGLKVPEKYKDIFVYAETYPSTSPLPKQSKNGYAYLIAPDATSVGQFYIWTDESSGYETFTPDYGWYLQEETVDRLTNFATDLTAPPSFISPVDGSIKYREFEYFSGIRVVVETMQKDSAIFDLIEISPRLSANLTDKTVAFDVQKAASDLGVSGLPVSQLLTSTGSLSLFDYDDAFNYNNSLSIIKDYITRHMQVKLYEIIVDVDGYDYYVPIKTMYSSGFPKLNNKDKSVDLELKDLYFYFDSLTAPQMLLTNVSTSTAVSLLLDSIGFSNYMFKRVPEETELEIPFFFIPPDKSVAEILQDIAVSTQTAMFLDEYNNFVMMSKKYMLPSESDRSTDITLRGSVDLESTSVYKNKTIDNDDNNLTATKLANIIEISSQDNNVYNGGKINYTSRYIQRSYGSIKQASMIDNDKTWIYKPVLLWEVGGTENTKSINNEVGNGSSYMLSAIPLNSDLSDVIPYVANNQIKNNILDLGEGVYWITRYSGYFYSSGEIIRFDAVEYNISGVGNVWINNVQEYQKYFSEISFNGKIYPTGRVRIYAEPNYEEVLGVIKLKNGKVAKHGRGQFGTTIVSHSAGLNPYWYDDNNVRGCTMQSKYLFNTPQLEYPGQATKDLSLVVGPAGIDNTLAKKTTRNGIIRNFLSSQYISEADIKSKRSTETGSIQSSALVMSGPSFTTTETPVDFISYVYKPLTDKFKHFGARMRIVGRLQNSSGTVQTAVGSTTYYTIPGDTPDKNISISGGSGGIGVMLNPSNNNGYYFEIVALGTTDVSTTTENTNVNNLIFYKVMQKSGTTEAIPVKLWEGLGQIVVDNGNFTGQSRMTTDQVVTVYDLAVEYENIPNGKRFFLYINGKLITTVEDTSPLPTYNNMALFTRGSSRIMFENIYAITNNYSKTTSGKNTSAELNTPFNSIFDPDEIDTNESFRKYALSGIIQGTMLSGVDQSSPPQYNVYFDEFGTIMREASTFNVKYDKAYPAIFAKLSPTFNRIKGYSVSGFRAGAYGAEFMVFNATDQALSLDASSGNYLRIQGITFTQENQNSLTVDDYFSKNSDPSNPDFKNGLLVSYPNKVAKEYQDIKLSRMTYGTKEFNLETPYVQTQDAANELMEWMIGKIMKPRKSLGIKVFSMPTVQLGDIVKVDYIENGIDKVGSVDKRFVVYNISYSKDSMGPSMVVFLSEVA
jgi:hypothetical protein